MPDNSAFQEFYLREIGVQTPLASHEASEPIAEREHYSSSIEKPVMANSEAALSVPPVNQTSSGNSSLQDIALQASTCTACALSEERHAVVFGVGDPKADIVFIGEAPGHEEDLKGEPFVGRAGKLLDRMLAAQGMDRSQVYIMNTVKCRPPNNRDPKPEEVQACGKWFDAQLRALSPKLICLLGRMAAQTVLETDAPLSAMRGKWHEYHGIPLRVIYHPAYLLRSPQQKRHAWSDLCELNKRYHLLG